jgi:gliding motility-associated-like protein
MCHFDAFLYFHGLIFRTLTNKKMNRFLFIFSCVLLIYGFNVKAQTYVFAQLSGSPVLNTQGWNITGNAMVTDTPGDANTFADELVLTPNASWQSGSIFLNSPINPALCTKWSVDFDFRIFGGSAADGIAFCFIDVPPTGFVSGAGMGIPGTANGLKVGLDTYNNCGGPNPELQIFSGAGYDECIPGMVKLENTSGNLNFIRNNAYQPARITYDNGLIELYINNTLYLTANFTLSFTGYMGFTASTGGNQDSHSIRNVVIYTEQADSDAGPDVSLCSENSVSIGSPSNSQYIYSWSPSTGLSSTSVSNPSLTLVNTGNSPQTYVYTVTTSLATNPGVCPTTDQVSVTVFPELTVLVTDTICTGGPYFFNGQSITNSGFYIDTLQSMNGCDSIVQLDLTISSPPQVTVSDAIICFGETAVLQPTGALNYSWSPAIGQVGSSGVLTISPTQTTVLNLSGFNGFQCASTVPVTITVLPIPNVEINALDSSLCAGEQVNLAASGALSYEWNGLQLAGNTSTSVNYLPTQSEWVYLMGESFEGCQAEDSLWIQVNELPDLVISGDTTICASEEVQLLVTGANTYSWSTGETSSSLVFAPTQTTPIQVVGTDINGCTGTLSTTITVFPMPNASFSSDVSVVSIDAPEVVFTNSSSGGLTDTWDFSFLPLFESNELSFEVTFPQVQGVYLVGLTVENEYGCVDDAFVSIQVVSDVIYYVPNAFTPDGDEFNQVFIPVFTSGFDPYNFIMEIYNRWGELIFISQNHLEGWDGSYGGYKCPSGVYSWKITYKTPSSDFKETITGHVELLH